MVFVAVSPFVLTILPLSHCTQSNMVVEIVKKDKKIYIQSVNGAKFIVQKQEEKII